MRLTRRGYGVLGVGVLAFLLALHAGPRSLNAVVAPALVVLGAAALHLRRRDEPSVARVAPQPGFPGEARAVELRVTADGPAAIRDRVDEALRVVDTHADADGEASALVAPATVDDDGSVAYEVELGRRGEHHLGPVTVLERDPLNLLQRATTETSRESLLVYPDVEPVTANRAFQGLVERAGTPDRQAFERLREYVPGDALRDVDWKSSAKRPGEELVVTEFARRDEGGVTVVAEADAGYGDEMAAAAASVAVYLLDADLSVGVAAPGGRVEERHGDEQRDRILGLLARTPAGRVSRNVEADVRLRADDDGVRVTVGEATFPFDELRPTDPQPDGARSGVVA